MQTVERRTIDDIEFEVEQLNIKDARACLVRLSHVLGPALTELAKSNAKDVLDVDTGVVASALGRLMTTMSEEDLEYFCGAFGKKSKVKVGELWLSVDKAGDSIFRGRLALMFKWLSFAAEVNYSDFLGVLTSMRGRLSVGAASPSTSPTESIGKSGDS